MSDMQFLARRMAVRHRYRAGEAEGRLARKGRVAKPYILAALNTSENPRKYLNKKLGNFQIRRGKVRFRAAYALCQARHRDVRLLRKLAEDDDDDVAFDVRVAMGYTKNRILAVYLAREVSRNGPYALAAAMGLGKFGARAVHEAVALSLQENRDARITAVHLLQDIDIPKSVVRLRQMVFDPDPVVRETATYALEEIQAKADRRAGSRS